MFPSMNRLYCGDNLKWLSDRKEFPDASIDLVYLAAPFNSRMRIQDRAKQSSGLLKKIWRPATVGQQKARCLWLYGCFFEEYPNKVSEERTGTVSEVTQHEFASGRRLFVRV